MTFAIPIIALRMPWKFDYHTALNRESA